MTLQIPVNIFAKKNLHVVYFRYFDCFRIYHVSIICQWSVHELARNASNFALEGRMFYANFFNTHNTYFATSVQVWDVNQNNIYGPDYGRRIFETTIQMTIDVGTFLPMTVMHVVLGEFERLGLEEVANNRFPLFRIPNQQDVFALLPTVILNIDPQSGGVIALNPTDYLENLHEDDDVYQLRITGHFFDEIWLGRHILKTLTVHVDNANGQIGFGDSLFDDTNNV